MSETAQPWDEFVAWCQSNMACDGCRGGRPCVQVAPATDKIAFLCPVDLLMFNAGIPLE